MIKRSLPPFLLLACSALLFTGCSDDGTGIGEGNQPYVDSWETVLDGPAAAIEFLSIGDRQTSDNFANRGDIEVNYVEGTDKITVEMQRFTIAKSQDIADENFAKLEPWRYNISAPEAPAPDMDPEACFAEEQTGCYVRVYYDGQIQPIRDGANFRVTLPVGWEGDLELVTEDNINEGIETYPDRSDVSVMGLNGNLAVDLDSGNVQVKVDPNIDHYAGCSGSADCEAANFDPMSCGCTEPTNIDISNNTGQASNITVDVSDASNWYTAKLVNEGMFSSSDDFVCNATIDCAPFADCGIDPDYANLDHEERAEINYPGEPAIAGGGIRVTLASDDCDNILYVNDENDYDSENLPEEKRGELLMCVGCL